jgi:uncharacterized protein (UPF0335 family)
MTDPKLKSLVERAERLIEERQALGADLRDIFTEAKSAGYEPKAMRKVIARRAANPDDLARDDALIETYEAALGAVGEALADIRKGATWKAASEKHGVPRATMARAAAVSKRREVIPDDGARSICPGERANEGAGSAAVEGLSPRLQHDVDSTPSASMKPEMGQPASSTVAFPDDLAFPAHLDRRRVSA